MNTADFELPAIKLPFPKNMSTQLADYIRLSSIPQTVLEEMQPGSDDDDAWYSFFYNAPINDHNVALKLAERHGVTIEQAQIAGVSTYTLIPSNISQHNRDRLIFGLHGGAFVTGGGQGGTCEAILMAHYSGIKVIAVDYRMPPAAQYPAALEDAVAVWQAVVKQNDPTKIGILGSSSGGNLTMAFVQHAISNGYALPGAVIAGTPWADLAGTGDSYVLNEACDIMSSVGLFWAAGQYAKGLSLTDPLVSPIYGSFAGFPPTMIIAGSRDMFLSDAARSNQKLREANVETQLLILEGQRHGDYATSAFNVDEAPPEVHFAWNEQAKFFDRHLAA
jgi:monoterpene epsilon-lactone hydrolase